MSLLNIGMTGLNAAQTSLATTGNNIANVDTKGYSRQQTVQTANDSTRYGSVFIGTGTTLADVRRVYNAYLDAQLQTSTSLNSDSAAYLEQVTPIDSLLSSTDTGMNASLSKFFTSLQNVNSNPSDDSGRQLFINNAGALAGRFNTIAGQLNQQSQTINATLTSSVSEVNKLASTIAQLNQKISEVSGNSGQPNELYDQRNEAVRQLSEMVGAQVISRGSSVDIYLGSGQPLVMGNTTNTLEVVQGKIDPTRSSIQMNRGASTIDITSVISGGSIGGLIRYRNEVLDPALNELGRVALVVADAINTQLAQGLDRNGQFGAALFNDINSAALISQRSIANAGNAATSDNLNVSIADSGKLTTSDYQVKFAAGGMYSVTRLSDNTSLGPFDINSTTPTVIDGFSLSLNGTNIAAGDSFKITPTRGAAAAITAVMTDPKTLAIAAPLTSTAAAGNTGTGVFTSQPTLKTDLSGFDASTKALMQAGIKTSTPIKLVFDAANAGVQSYTIRDAKGGNIGTGTIVPGQANTLTLQIPMVDGNGAAIMDGSVPPVQRTFTIEAPVSGSPSAGDSVNIGMTDASSKDNRNGLLVQGLQTAKTVETGATSGGISLTDAYGKLVANVGTKASQGKLDSEATSAILTQATAARDSVSGVDLDEETGNLVKFQQYYTASSQIIKAAQETFSVLINSL